MPNTSDLKFTRGDVMNIVIALDLAREAAFMDIRRTMERRSETVEAGSIIHQIAEWSRLTKKLESVLL